MGDSDDAQLDRLEALIKGDLAAYTYGNVDVPIDNLPAADLGLPAEPFVPAQPFVPVDFDNANVNGNIPAYIPASVEANDEGGRQLVGGSYMPFDEWMRAQNNNNNLLGDINANNPGPYYAGNLVPLALDFAASPDLGSQPQLLGVASVVPSPVMMPQEVLAQQVEIMPQQVVPLVMPQHQVMAQQVPPQEQEVMPQQAQGMPQQMPSPSPSPTPSPSNEGQQQLQEQQGQQQQQGQQDQQEKEEKPWDFAGHVLEKTWELKFREVPLADPNALLSEQLKAQFPETFERLRPRQPSADQQLPGLQAQQPVRVQQPSPPLSPHRSSQSPPPAAAAPRKRGRPKGSLNKKTLENMNLNRVMGPGARVTKSHSRSRGASVDPVTSKLAREPPAAAVKYVILTPTERSVLALRKQAEADAEHRFARQCREQAYLARRLGRKPIHEQELSEQQVEAMLEEEKETKAKWMQEYLDRRIAAEPIIRHRIGEEGMLVLFPGYVEKRKEKE